MDPVRILSFQGRVDFADDVARWYQRSLTLKASHWCRVNIGNFKGIADRGLFTGYFPFQDESDETFLKTGYMADMLPGME